MPDAFRRNANLSLVLYFYFFILFFKRPVMDGGDFRRNSYFTSCVCDNIDRAYHRYSLMIPASCPSGRNCFFARYKRRWVGGDGGGGVLDIMHAPYSSRHLTFAHPTAPGRSTSGFHRPGTNTARLHTSAERPWGVWRV